MQVAATETVFSLPPVSDSSSEILKGAEQCIKQIDSHVVALYILGKFPSLSASFK